MQPYNKLNANQPQRTYKHDASKTLENMPPMPTKSEVANYFGFSNVYYFFSKILFVRILKDSEYTYEEFKMSKTIPTGLALEIYEHLGWIERKQTA